MSHPHDEGVVYVARSLGPTDAPFVAASLNVCGRVDDFPRSEIDGLIELSFFKGIYEYGLQNR